MTAIYAAPKVFRTSEGGLIEAPNVLRTGRGAVWSPAVGDCRAPLREGFELQCDLIDAPEAVPAGGVYMVCAGEPFQFLCQVAVRG